jgi:protein-disulfide isomerase
MIRALASRAAAFVAATALLAACGGEAANPASSFKPVPVTPVLTDVPVGSDTAPVTMIEYASLVCSHCRDFAKQVMPRIQREYIDTGKVKYIYRDMSIHPAGFDVALASLTRCKGPELHHVMVEEVFANFADIMDAAAQGKAADVLAAITAKHGITWDEAVTCMDHSPELKASIVKSGDQGEAEAKAAQPTIQGRKTPTVFINGKYLGDGISYENVKAEIEAALTGQPVVAPTGAETPAPAAPSATPPAQ